jgi:hypothetical protein
MHDSDRAHLLEIVTSSLVTIREAAQSGLRAIAILKGDPGEDTEELGELEKVFGGSIKGEANGNPEERIKRSGITARGKGGRN